MVYIIYFEEKQGLPRTVKHLNDYVIDDIIVMIVMILVLIRKGRMRALCRY